MAVAAQRTGVVLFFRPLSSPRSGDVGGAGAPDKLRPTEGRPKVNIGHENQARRRAMR